MRYDSISFASDTAVGTMGTFAGFHVSEVTGLIVALTNLAYIVFRVIRHFNDNKNNTNTNT